MEMDQELESHPSRVRGLKYLVYWTYSPIFLVAPLAGAWIEINNDAGVEVLKTGRTPRGCVD